MARKALKAAGQRFELAGVIRVDVLVEFHDRAELDEPGGQDGVGSREAGELVARRLRVGATGPVARAVFAAVNTIEIATGNITSDADQITNGELVDTLPDRFDVAAHFVQENGGPLEDSR